MVVFVCSSITIRIVNLNKTNEPSKPNESKPSEPSTPNESKPSEPSIPNESKPSEPSKPNESKPSEPETNVSKLADGVWYGTGTWSRYYIQKGPDIVKVTVENNKIKNIETVVYTDETVKVFKKGLNIFNSLINLDDTDKISKQLENKSGEAYDAVSHATETAKGHTKLKLHLNTGEIKTIDFNEIVLKLKGGLPKLGNPSCYYLPLNYSKSYGFTLI